MSIRQTPLLCAQEQLLRGSGIEGSLRGTVVTKAVQWICQGTVTWGMKRLRGEERVPHGLDGFLRMVRCWCKCRLPRLLPGGCQHTSIPWRALRECGMLTVSLSSRAAGLGTLRALYKKLRGFGISDWVLKSNGRFRCNVSLLQMPLSRGRGLM